MKTFVPIAGPRGQPWKGLEMSLRVLDNQRLGKQRVESYQIWLILSGRGSTTNAWRKHPATHQWRGYTKALEIYLLLNCQVWGERLNKDGLPMSNENMAKHIQNYGWGRDEKGRTIPMEQIKWPWWWGNEDVHNSDAAVLYRKDKKYYPQFKQYSKKYPDLINDKGTPIMGYIWPYMINPYHPEQKEELDKVEAAEQIIIAAKEKKEAEKKAKKEEEKAARKAVRDAERAEKTAAKEAAKAAVKAEKLATRKRKKMDTSTEEMIVEEVQEADEGNTSDMSMSSSSSSSSTPASLSAPSSPSQALSTAAPFSGVNSLITLDMSSLGGVSDSLTVRRSKRLARSYHTTANQSGVTSSYTSVISQTTTITSTTTVSAN